MESVEAEQIRTTVAIFNGVLRDAGTNNYYCCNPSEGDANILILRMPRVRGDRTTFVEVIRFTLVGDQGEGRTVYITGANELSNWWRQQLAAAMMEAQARA